MYAPGKLETTFKTAWASFYKPVDYLQRTYGTYAKIENNRTRTTDVIDQQEASESDRDISRKYA